MSVKYTECLGCGVQTRSKVGYCSSSTCYKMQRHNNYVSSRPVRMQLYEEDEATGCIFVKRDGSTCDKLGAGGRCLIHKDSRIAKKCAGCNLYTSRRTGVCTACSLKPNESVEQSDRFSDSGFDSDADQAYIEPLADHKIMLALMREYIKKYEDQSSS